MFWLVLTIALTLIKCKTSKLRSDVYLSGINGIVSVSSRKVFHVFNHGLFSHLLFFFVRLILVICVYIFSVYSLSLDAL